MSIFSRVKDALRQRRKAKDADVIPGYVIIQALMIKEARAINAGRKGGRS